MMPEFCQQAVDFPAWPGWRKAFTGAIRHEGDRTIQATPQTSDWSGRGSVYFMGSAGRAHADPLGGPQAGTCPAGYYRA